jgi:hypothetical protein
MLLRRFAEEGVEYMLVGGQAVRLHGFVRATEDVDVLVRRGRDNGERVVRALDFLDSAREIDPGWFDQSEGEPENIRVADRLIVDLLFTANGETWESLRDHVTTVDLDGVPARLVDIEGLLLTKTDWRDKDVLDRRVLLRIVEDLRRRDAGHEPSP